MVHPGGFAVSFLSISALVTWGESVEVPGAMYRLPVDVRLDGASLGRLKVIQCESCTFYLMPNK